MALNLGVQKQIAERCEQMLKSAIANIASDFKLPNDLQRCRYHSLHNDKKLSNSGGLDEQMEVAKTWTH